MKCISTFFMRILVDEDSGCDVSGKPLVALDNFGHPMSQSS